MKEYHKIQTVFLRDPETKFKTLLEGQFAKPEFAYLRSNKWVFTEKVDGTNIRVRINHYEEEEPIAFQGKTDRAQIPTFLLSSLEELFKSGKALEVFDGPVCLYGEGYGPKIQKGGGNYRRDPSFVLFDIRVGNWWLTRESVEEIGGELGLDVVPVIGEGTLHDMVELTRQGFNSQWGDFVAEGIVARPKIELCGRDGKRIITKIKYKDFPIEGGPR